MLTQREMIGLKFMILEIRSTKEDVKKIKKEAIVQGKNNTQLYFIHECIRIINIVIQV